MAYDLHIERHSPISIDEWLAAVEATENVKIDGSDFIATNATTDAVIQIPNSPETAAVWFPESEEWIKVFGFKHGKVTFNARSWDSENSPIRNAAFALADKLNAEIFGDDGEKY